MRAGLAVFLWMLMSFLWANEPSPVWFTKAADKPAVLSVDLFLSSSCEHCQQADAWFKTVEPDTPWIKVTRHYIDKDKDALKQFGQFLQYKQADDFMVPSIFFCDSRWTGFRTAETSGAALLDGLNYCRKAIEKSGTLSPVTEQVLTQMAYGNNLSQNPSVSWFLPVMAFIDALNLPILYSIMTLFTLLLLQKTRHQYVITILMFLLGTVVAHHIQQAHPIFLFRILSLSHWILVALGLALLAGVAAYQRRMSMAFAIVSPLLVFLSAIAVQLLQQQAMSDSRPDFSMIFEQWLLTKNYAPLHLAFYELLFQIVYVGIIALLVWGVWALCHLKGRWQERQTFLRWFACAYLIMIALMMILVPGLFRSGLFAVTAIVLSGLVAWAGSRLLCK